MTHALAHAIEHDETYGTWGGLSADERRALRRRRLPHRRDVGR